MNNEPVAYVDNVWINRPDLAMDLGIGQMFSRCQLSDHQIPLYTHPVKELHLSLQKSKQTGELLAVTYTDDEHRIVEVLWQRPPVKELTDEEIEEIAEEFKDVDYTLDDEEAFDVFNHRGFARAILRKAQEK